MNDQNTFDSERSAFGDERSAFGVIHKATEYYGSQEYLSPEEQKRKETIRQVGAGAAGGAAATLGVGAAGAGYVGHKAKPAIKAYRAGKRLIQPTDHAAKGARKTWRAVQTLLKI